MRFFILAAAAFFIFAAPRRAPSKTMSQETIQPPPRRAVVLVHGMWDKAAKMDQMAGYLRKQGFTVFTPTLRPSWGQVGLDELAKQLSAYIDANIHPGEKFDLVGFSMGALVCRYYLQRMDGLRRVDHFITLGGPHHGSLWACLLGSPGYRQMRPGSDFINDLNGDIAVLEKTKFTSIWTPFDLIIVPSTSSRTSVGRNIMVWVPIHPLLVWSPTVIKRVADLLKS